jgi:uncharacterized membrane protein YgdD (TMEM256/DUF423 family)
MLPRLFGVLGCAFALGFVVLSALGAHLFELDAINQRRLHTALAMLIVHGLALLLLRAAPKTHAFAPKLEPALALAGLCFVFGVLLFCGSLLLAALAGAMGLLALAPFGGVLLMLGWLLFALSIWRAA